MCIGAHFVHVQSKQEVLDILLLFQKNSENKAGHHEAKTVFRVKNTLQAADVFQIAQNVDLKTVFFSLARLLLKTVWLHVIGIRSQDD